jgi:hypothetical protein
MLIRALSMAWWLLVLTSQTFAGPFILTCDDKPGTSEGMKEAESAAKSGTWAFFVEPHVREICLGQRSHGSSDSEATRYTCSALNFGRKNAGGGYPTGLMGIDFFKCEQAYPDLIK